MPPALPSHGASEEPAGAPAPDSLDHPARPVGASSSSRPCPDAPLPDEDAGADGDRDLLLLRAILDGPLFS